MNRAWRRCRASLPRPRRVRVRARARPRARIRAFRPRPGARRRGGLARCPLPSAAVPAPLHPSPPAHCLPGFRRLPYSMRSGWKQLLCGRREALVPEAARRNPYFSSRWGIPQGQKAKGSLGSRRERKQTALACRTLLGTRSWPSDGCFTLLGRFEGRLSTLLCAATMVVNFK